jgi:hypothetical protein
MNAVTIRDVNMSLDVDEFFEEFDKMIIFFLIDMFSEYNQLILAKECRDITVIQIILELLRQIMLLQEEVNSVAQFVRVMIKILESLISELCRVFLDDIDVKNSQSRYNDA